MKISCKLLALSVFQPMVWTNGFSIALPGTTGRVQSAGALYSTIPGVSGFGTTAPGTAAPVFPTTSASPDTNQSWKVGSTGFTKGMLSKEQVWEKSNAVVVQGGSLRTCSFDESVERVQVILKSEGRPLNSNVELWQGPDNSPQKINVYLEDGGARQFRAIIETPRASNAVCIRNTANMEFPLTACVDSDVEDSNGNANANPREMLKNCKSKVVQGGAVNTTPFPPSVSSVQIMLQTDGRPLNARIELLQGPNNNKQVMEVYIEDGSDRPFYAIVDTPGSGNVVRIVNTSTVEFPMAATVEAYETDVQEDQSYSGGMTWSE